MSVSGLIGFRMAFHKRIYLQQPLIIKKGVLRSASSYKWKFQLPMWFYHILGIFSIVYNDPFDDALNYMI